MRWTPVQTSPNGFHCIGKREPEAGTLRMNRLVSDPTTAIPSSIPPMISGSPFQRAKRNDPTLVPSTMAAKVESSSSPLARVNCASGSISGRMPYFAGLKKLACMREQEQNHQQHFDAAQVEREHADAHD